MTDIDAFKESTAGKRRQINTQPERTSGGERIAEGDGVGKGKLDAEPSVVIPLRRDLWHGPRLLLLRGGRR